MLLPRFVPGPRLGAVTQMRCMIMANRRASADRFFIRDAGIASPGLKHDHFFDTAALSRFVS